MKAQLLLLVGGVLGGLGLGWFAAPVPEASPSARLDVPAIAHASVETGAARERLADLGLVPPPQVEVAPPPPDVAVLFRRDLTAIEERGATRVAWIVDHAQMNQRRALRVGDIYQGGWRVARIAPQAIELRRRREVRTIDAFALPVIEP
jgi:hypothetical protein